MTEFRITKYDPKHRKNGIYQVEEWTSIGDIGRIFPSGILTLDQYKKVEQAYIECCIDLLQEANVAELSVSGLECYHTEIHFPNKLHEESDIRRMIASCLQEKCWAKLEASNFFIHFGYDYYMYIGTNLPRSLVEETAKKHKLFCELYYSPYRDGYLNDV